MTLEAALFRPALKPVVDALLLRFRQRRQLIQTIQTETTEKLLGRAKQNRPSDRILAADFLDHPALDQRIDHTVRLHAADILYILPGNRLSECDNR